MAEVLEFELKAGSNGLKKALSDSSREADSLSKKLGDSFKSFPVSPVVKVVALAVAAFKTLDASMSAFVEKENAINKISQSLRVTGESSVAATQGIINFSDAMQASSKFSMEEVSSQVALAKSMGQTTAKSKEIVKAAIEMEAVFGTNLEQGVRALTMSLNGQGAALAKLSPEFKNMTEQQLKSGEAIELLNGKFGGSAQSSMQSYSGSLKLMRDAFNESTTEIGEAAVRFIEWSNAIPFATSAMQGFADGLKQINLYLGNGTEYEQSYVKIKKLSEEYDNASKSLTELEKSLVSVSAKTGIVDDIFVGIENKKKEIAAIKSELDGLQKKVQEGSLNGAPGKGNKTGETVDRDDSAVAAEKEKIRMLQNIRQQSALEESNYFKQMENSKIQDEATRNAAELERIYQFDQEKRLLQQQLDLEKAATIKDAKTRMAEENFINEQADFDILKRRNQLEIELEKDKNERLSKEQAKSVKDKEESLQATLSITQSAFSIMSSMAKAGGKEQYRIQKASAIAESFIAIQLAIAKATSSAPFPANLPAIAAVAAQGASLISKIKGSSGPGYAEGGIIGGATRGGDNRTAQVRDGEMVLNADQQKRLFDAINSGSIGGAPIVVQIDGREIARAVRTQKQQGFAV